MKDLKPHFRGNTLVAYGEGDAVVTAKAICEWLGKENFDVQVKSGSALGQVMSQAQIIALLKRLCREHGTRVIGEGVETQAEADTLIELGCVYAQGYRYSRPVPAAQFRKLLIEQTAPARA